MLEADVTCAQQLHHMSKEAGVGIMVAAALVMLG